MTAADFAELVPEPIDFASLAAAVAHAQASARPTILWIHESTHLAWGIPEDPKRLSEVIDLPPDARSSDGWVRLGHNVHVSFPYYSGDFAECETPADLRRAVELFRELVGVRFLYSAPATALYLIDDRNLARPRVPSGVAFDQSAFAIPAHTWTRPLTDDERAAPFAQLVDRRGSYLAAWRSVVLPDGEWIRRDDPITLSTLGPVAGPGYYLIDTGPLGPFLDAQGLHDPFVRHPAGEGARWLTSPLAALAAELAEEAGVELRAERRVIGTRSVRALDRVADRLSSAMTALERSEDPVAPAVRSVVKDAYTRGTAHLEYGKRAPHPLHRPDWRHTIIDRHLANTYRSLRKAQVRPFSVGGIDSALFAASSPTSWPIGLKAGPELGSWRLRRTMDLPGLAASAAENRRSLLFEMTRAVAS